MAAAMKNNVDEPPKFNDIFILIREDFNNMKMVLRCGICCSTLRDPVVTTCLHAFCRVCFDLCIDKLKTLRCPICNQHLNKRSCGNCPQLLSLIHDYLRLAMTYKRDCSNIRFPKEAEFLESQAIMTQNIGQAVGRSPLRQTTNIAKKQPQRSRQCMKRALHSSDSNTIHLQGKKARTGANSTKGQQSEMCPPIVPLNRKQPNSALQSPLNSSLTSANEAVANHSSWLSTQSVRGRRLDCGRENPKIADRLKSEASMLSSVSAEISVDRVEELNADKTVTAEWSKGQCASMLMNAKAVEKIDMSKRPYPARSVLMHSQKRDENGIAFSEAEIVTKGKAEQSSMHNANGVERAPQGCFKAAECYAQHSSNLRTASAQTEVCRREEIGSEVPLVAEHRNVEAQMVQKCEIAVKTKPMHNLGHTSVQTMFEYKDKHEERDIGTQVSILPAERRNVTVQTMQKCCEVGLQTETGHNFGHASVQTVFECNEIGVQVTQPTKEFKEAFIQTELENSFRQTVGNYAQTDMEKTSRVRSDVDDAVAIVELMVNRRFEKQSAETRVQALLASLPWIPTFLRLDYDGFCQRFGDDLAVTSTPLQQHINDECHSVVEASEGEAEKSEMAVANADKAELAQNRHLKLDLDLPKGNQNDQQTLSPLEEGLTLPNICQHNYSWASQQNANASKITAVIASKDVVTDSLETCSFQSSIKFMVSGLTNSSEVEDVKEFLRAFPMARFSCDMVRDCTHLIIFKTDGRLCKSRSLKYAYSIANRGFVVTHEWLKDCVKFNRLLPIICHEEAKTARYLCRDGWNLSSPSRKLRELVLDHQIKDEYEVEGDMQVNQTSRAARRSREGSGNLFAGFTFYLPEPYFRFSKIVTKDRLSEIIQMMGGQCVEHLWDLSSSNCAYIIFAPGSCSADAARRFELDRGVEVLRADWVLDSICEYRVLQSNTQIYRVANRFI